MILSRTSQYAIQALIYIATQPPGEPVLNREIAAHLGVPSAYLAKIMQNLCKGNLLNSFRGRLGGFCLREGAEKTDLMQVLVLTEGKGFTDDCVLGLKVCSDETACPMHVRWKPIKEKVVSMLNEQTLEKLAEAVQSGNYRITDLPHAVLGV
ncbi:MAG: Rrf2 family transcriptional regulator [Pseudomonadota bacterium]|jgi:Rrf2 family protein|nr:Rrf2 family transcriptional regulator [Gammaproteobacteria bacterium]MBU1733278.1 Rrf2 family transcriptional regulator [Gammaproteobacteria bacterium]MBU1892326.1 Rrf2 family transcriptional regulator [Gammaproteobacteria bacterium]